VRELARLETPLIDRFVDRIVSILSPKRGIERAKARLVQRHIRRFSYKSAINSRLDRASSKTTSSSSWNDRRGGSRLSSGVSADLADRAIELTEDNPIARGVVLRLTERIVGPHIRFVARTKSKAWNRQHADLWGKWVDDADIRDMSSLYGLIAFIVNCQLVQNRCGVILHDSGRIQIVEGVRIETPPKKRATDNIVDGVEMDKFGKPIRFWVVDDPDSSQATHKAVSARDFVYFPLRDRFGDTTGKNVFAQSFDNFEQVDAVIEGVTAAAQMAANFGLLMRTEGSDDYVGSTEPGSDSDGDPARIFDIEPGMVQWLGDNESVDQVKPEHPKQNLVEFLRHVMRVAGLPAGVPLEVLLQDYTQLTFHGGRAMYRALDDFCESYRSWHLDKGLRRIYRWRTSKWIKEGLLKPRTDAWKHKIIPPGRFVIEQDREQKADGMSLDFLTTSYTDLAEKRGKTRDELFDEIAEDEAELAARGLVRQNSNLTRDKGTAATPQNQQGA